MERYSVVTRKGQVTVPAEIREALGIVRGDKVAFLLDDGEVRLRRLGSIVEATAGVLKSDRPPMSAEEERQAAEEAIAQSVLERSGR